MKELLSTHECNIYSNSDAAKFALYPSIQSPPVTSLSRLIFKPVKMYYPTQQVYDIKTLPPPPPLLSSSPSPSPCPCHSPPLSPSPYVKYDKS